KPIGNGFPLGAVVTTRAIADSFAGGMEYFNTFGGNPVSCAAGLAVLDVIRDEKLQENARTVGEYLKTGLMSLPKECLFLGDVRGMGLFLGLEFVTNPVKKTPDAARAGYVVERMKEEGILLSTDGPDHNVVKFKPPLVFSKPNADLFLSKLEDILKEDVFHY
ncbi:MAG: aminotransferase class III-fold pyridoxal phosphate-dependent enzyme, partial [Candidatus Aminicenantes bacterium]|nr:aminotransferase class III-fold pyridoxal phosphate-dependent enzyme [Candidatus Aminicenantes bacterium]